MNRLALALLAVSALGPAMAQDVEERPGSRARRFLDNCEDWGDRDREVFCEVRDVTIKAPDRTLLVDGRENGSIRVWAWDRSDVLVRALIQATGDSRTEARDAAREIRVETDADRIRATGPSWRQYRGWSVSYELWVPRRMNVEAETSNGGVSVEGVEGRLTLRAVNGGISLRAVSGDVRGHTSNGAVSVQLDGTTWKGEGLDVETSNGSVNLEIPRDFNAQLETGTVNGSVNVDFPITVQGSIGRRITSTLGRGGPRVRAVTTNGAVRIVERR